jgi:hypothetical protein
MLDIINDSRARMLFIEAELFGQLAGRHAGMMFSDGAICASTAINAVLEPDEGSVLLIPMPQWNLRSSPGPAGTSAGNAI